MAPIIPNSSAETDFLRLEKLVDFCSSSQEVIAVTVPLPGTEPLVQAVQTVNSGRPSIKVRNKSRLLCIYR
jgi:hypothetical protein